MNHKILYLGEVKPDIEELGRRGDPWAAPVSIQATFTLRHFSP